jgi:hypothetical protein
MRQQQEEEEQQMWEELTFDQQFELHKKVYPDFKRECDEFRRDTQKTKRAV